MRKAWRLAREIVTLPPIQLRLFGGPRARSLYESFTKPHPRYRVIQNKRWGAGLLRIPDVFESYLTGKAMTEVRQKRNRCLARGFYFDRIEPLDHVGPILAINRSLAERQGRRMHEAYLDEPSVRRYFASAESVYGVFNQQRLLRAHADVPLIGEVATLARLLGHGDDLRAGVMYLLISEIVREMVGRRKSVGEPGWLLYDTLLGASPGLREFKEHLGFRPYRVRWAWIPTGEEASRDGGNGEPGK